MQLNTFYTFLEIHDARYRFMVESRTKYKNQKEFDDAISYVLSKDCSPILSMIDLAKESDIDWKHLEDLLSNENDILLTTEEVAERYKIPKQTQKIYREKQGLPFTKPGKRILYNKVLLDMWLRQYSVNEAAEETT